jgi:nucleoside-diphosphate-sugar epimerase
MIKPRIAVTGATGKTGSGVVSELLRVGYLVRAIVHREDGRSARELRRPFPSAPRFAAESAIWRNEHDIPDLIQPTMPGRKGESHQVRNGVRLPSINERSK